MFVRPVVIVSFVVCLFKNALQQSPAQITNISPPLQHKVGDNAVLVCTVTNLMDQPVVWMKDNAIIARQDVITTGDRRIYASRNPTANTYYLTIRGVQESDSGIYKCGVTDRNQQVATSRETSMIVTNVVQPHYPRPQPQPQPQPRPWPQPQPQPQPRPGPHSGGLMDNSIIVSSTPPQEKTIGDSVSLTCRVKDIENSRVMWIRWDDSTSIASDDVVYSHDPRFEAHKDIGSSTFILRINNVQDKDTGMYKCNVYTRGHSTPESREIRLDVIRPSAPSYKVPKITYISQAQTRDEGDEAVLSCRVQDVGEHPVVWTKDGVPVSTDEDIISMDPRHHIAKDPSTETFHLRIENVQASDTGNYTCEILLSPHLPTSKVSHSVILRVSPRSQPQPYPSTRIPSIVSISGERLHSPGESTSMSCTVQNGEGAEVIWMKDNRINLARNGELAVRDPRFSVAQDGLGLTHTIQITNLQESDAGTYSCVVYSPSVGRISKDVPLRIIQKQNPGPGPVYRLPKITYISSERVKTTGESTSLTCTVENAEDTEVMWMKDSTTTITIGADMRIREPRFSVSRALGAPTFTLTITNLQESDSGIYSCVIASRDVGRISKDVPLKVIGRIGPVTPSITSISTDRTQNIGESTTLTCKVENAQDSQVLWIKDGQSTITMNDRLLLQDRRYRIRKESDGSHHLYIENVQPQDAGTYSCVVRSRGGGRISKDVTLRVDGGGGGSVTVSPSITSISTDRTQKIGESTTLTCKVENAQDSQVLWIRDRLSTLTANDLLIVPDRRFRIRKESDGSHHLYIENVQPEDAGTYSCVVHSNGGARISKDVILRVDGGGGGSVTVPPPPRRGVPMIVQVSEPQVKNVGEYTTISCLVQDVENSPQAQVVWMKDETITVSVNDQIYNQDPRYRISKNGNSYDLSINYLQEQDSGTYSCVLYSQESGRESKDVSVRVSRHTGHGGGSDPAPSTRRPRIVDTTRQPVKYEGESVNLECTVANADDMPLIWRKEGDVLTMGALRSSDDARISVQYIDENSTYILTIRGLRVEDSGNYICELPVTAEEILRGSIDLRVIPVTNPRPREPSQIYFHPNSSTVVTANENEVATLECYAGGNPPPQVTWSRPDGDVLPNGGRSVVGNILMIPSVENIHAGSYICTAENGYSPSVQHTVQLQVQYAPIVIPQDLNIIRPIGNPVEIRCEVQAYPKPYQVTWLKDNAMITPSSRHNIQTVNQREDMTESILQIAALDRNDYGDYTCRASNNLGSDEAKIEVREGIPQTTIIPPTNPPPPTREFPPRIAVDSAQRAVAEGSNIDLRCRVQASPRAEIYWYKDYLPIKETPYVRIENATVSAEEVSSILHIYSVQREHYGSYTCRARNSLGIDQRNVDLRPDEPDITTLPPNTNNPGECNLDDNYLEAVSTKIADRITLKVLSNLEQIGQEYDKLEQVVNELQNEYQNIDREIKMYYNRQ